MTAPGLAERAAALMGQPVAAIAPLGGGGNSRVYRLETGDGGQLALKWYFHDGRDTRDRLNVEFRALQFLWTRGVRTVPRPIAASPADAIAIYEFIDGRPVMSAPVDEADIDAALGLVRQWRDLRSDVEAKDLPSASEACFSLEELRGNLERRVARLEGLAEDTDAASALRQFLAREFRPAMRATVEQSGDRLRRAGVATDAPLALAHRTLSSSDFGLHNAIRRDGEPVFIDFEYFGWDDPAKLIDDFLLHPAMPLADPLRDRFAQGVLRVFTDEPTLGVRASALYPIFALKWCLIVLNEFLPEKLRRRRFAAESSAAAHDIQMRQLEKARRLVAAAATPVVM